MLAWSKSLAAALVSFAFAPGTSGAQLVYVTHWGEYGQGPGQLAYPTGIAVAPDGHVYVSDGWNNRICRFTPDGKFVASFGGAGSGPGKFQGPDHLQFSPTNGDLYVTDKNNHRIQRFTESGAFVLQWGSFGTGPGQFAAPWGIHVDSAGDVWVVSREQTRLQKFTENGVFLTQWGIPGTGFGQFLKPHGIATDEAGNIYVSDVERHDIQKFDAFGEYLLEWGSPGSLPGQFLHPHHLTYRSSEIVVVDWLEHPHGGRLTAFTTEGTLTGVLVAGSQGTGELQFHTPYGVAYDPQGLWYVAEFGNHRVQKLREGAVAVESAGSSDLRVLGDPTPNPFSGAVRVQVSLPHGATGTYELSIFDARGARVFARLLETPGPRSLSFEWNGTNLSGRAASAGVYFVALRGDGIRETRKVVRIE